MLLLLLTWSFLFFTILNLGFAFDKITFLKSNNFIIIAILGLLSVTILASIWAFFGRINIEFQLFLLLLQCFILLPFKKEISVVYQSIWKQIKALSIRLKFFLFSLTLLLLVKSTAASNFIDNETYYIQTIKWLNEFGFVKGLGNLHIFFGQTSGWHILQSALNFSFIDKTGNSLNGFFLLLITFFAVLKLNTFDENKNKILLVLVLLPMMNVFFFQFIPAPSPDLAVYLLSLLVFYYFIKHFEEASIENFNLIFILSVFIVFIKITALPMLLLPLILLISNFKLFKSKLGLSCVIGFLVLLVFILKNLILTGYPLFPSLLFKAYFQFDYALPIEVYQFSFNQAKNYDFFISSADYSQLDGFSIFIKWLTQSKINSIFNGFTIFLLFGIPLYLHRFLNKKPYWWLYTVMVIQVIFLFATSPQYRFVIPFLVFFGLLFLSFWFRNKKQLENALLLSLIPLLLVVIFASKIENQRNTIVFKSASFSKKQLMFPSKNSSLNTVFHSEIIGNLRYSSPDNKTYIWATGDGSLPCVNAKQVQYFKRQLGYIPQQRTLNLKDGFYSKKISNP